MRANLPQREPEFLRRWEAADLYGELRARGRGRPRWILHDGPPYANGHIHMGTALNKVLKDIVVKSRTMFGHDAVYVPGWDCHGLPIEHQVDKELGLDKAGSDVRRAMDPAEKRRRCRAYALRFIDIQREEFRRLGIFGDWAHPYLTMAPAYQATIVREFGRFVGRGLVYKGLKPVHWCMHCKTALAQAEVEYEEQETPSVYVKFPLVAPVPGLAGAPRPSVVIWTTTPWTLPANLAVAVNPSEKYVALDTGAETLIVAAGLADQVVRVARLKIRAPPPDLRGDRARGARVPASLDRAHGPDRGGLVRRDGRGNRPGPHRPGPRRGGLRARAGARAADLQSGRRRRALRPRDRPLRRAHGLGREPADHRAPAGAGRAGRRGGAHPHVSPLLALQEPDALPGDRAVVHHARPGAARRGRRDPPRAGARRPPDRPVDPAVGRGAHHEHDRAPARLDDLAPARVGRPDRGVLLRGLRHDAPRGADRRARRRPHGSRRGRRRVVPPHGRGAAPRRDRVREVRRPRRSGRRPTSSMSGSTRDAATRPSWRSTRSCGWPADMYLEGSDQHRGWFHSSLLEGGGHPRAPAVPRGADPRVRGGRRGAEDVEVHREHRGPGRRHREARRRGPAALGGGRGLHGGHPAVRRDPRPAGGGVPAGAQHLPLPPREPRGLRPGAGRGPGRRPSRAWTAGRCSGSTGRSSGCGRPTRPTSSTWRSRASTTSVRWTSRRSISTS